MSYHCPTELDDALDFASRHDGLIVAGGTDVYPAITPKALGRPFLDITRIAGLRGITEDDGGYRIGGATTWTDICRADLPPAFDGLKAAAREVGSVQIQNVGTVAGNLCNASPAADGVPPLLTLDASVELASKDAGTRSLPLAEFITGPRQTARRAGELLTAIHIPRPPEDARGSFEKLGSRRYLVISIAMTAALVARDASGRITEARVAVGAASPVARRLNSLEADLVGRRADDVHISADHLAGLSPIDDVRGTAEYRLDVVAEQVARAIRKAMRP